MYLILYERLAHCHWLNQVSVFLLVDKLEIEPIAVRPKIIQIILWLRHLTIGLFILVELENVS